MCTGSVLPSFLLYGLDSVAYSSLPVDLFIYDIRTCSGIGLLSFVVLIAKLLRYWIVLRVVHPRIVAARFFFDQQAF